MAVNTETDLEYARRLRGRIEAAEAELQRKIADFDAQAVEMRSAIDDAKAECADIISRLSEGQQ